MENSEEISSSVAGSNFLLAVELGVLIHSDTRPLHPLNSERDGEADQRRSIGAKREVWNSRRFGGEDKAASNEYEGPGGYLSFHEEGDKNVWRRFKAGQGLGLSFL